MTDRTLTQARAGDEQAFRELTDHHRRELQLHCYRILGSVQDAEDMVQETLLAAWRGLARFEERASVRSWLYRIATNRCLNALRDSGRRPRAQPPPEPPFEPAEPTRRAEPLWLEPYPDVLLDGIPETAPGPEARYEAKESISLAFVAAAPAPPAPPAGRAPAARCPRLPGRRGGRHAGQHRDLGQQRAAAGAGHAGRPPARGRPRAAAAAALAARARCSPSASRRPTRAATSTACCGC